MDFEFLIDGSPRRISLENRDGAVYFREGEVAVEAEVRRISSAELLFTFGGRTSRIHLARDGERAFVSVAGREFVITEPLPGTRGPLEGDEAGVQGSFLVKSPMPGRVIKLSVGEGQPVRKNQALAIVEAMKMENEIQSPAEGIVKKIHVSVGEFVDSEKPLMEIESTK